MVWDTCGLNCVPLNLWVEALSPSLTVFEDAAFKEVLKVKSVIRLEASSTGTCFLKNSRVSRRALAQRKAVWGPGWGGHRGQHPLPRGETSQGSRLPTLDLDFSLLLLRGSELSLLGYPVHGISLQPPKLTDADTFKTIVCSGNSGSHLKTVCEGLGGCFQKTKKHL